MELNNNKLWDLFGFRAPIAGVALRKLHLEGNAISDIRPLAHLPALELLSLGDNDIIDITALGEMTSLRELWLANNNIADISPLFALKNCRMAIADGE